MNTQIMPTVLKAEQALLGALLRAVWPPIVDQLASAMFADPVHNAIFERLKGYDARDRNPCLLIDDIGSATENPDPLLDHLQEVGGLPYLEALRDIEALDVADLAEQVREAWRLRTLVDIGENVAALGSDLVQTAFEGRPSENLTRMMHLRLHGYLLQLEKMGGGSGAPAA